VLLKLVVKGQGVEAKTKTMIFLSLSRPQGQEQS